MSILCIAVPATHSQPGKDVLPGPFFVLLGAENECCGFIAAGKASRRATCFKPLLSTTQ